MKKLICLSTICLLISSGIFAQSSILNLRMLNRNQFSFTLDGVNYPVASHQRLENLRPGNHFLSIYSTNFRKNGFGYKVIFRGNLFIESSTESFVTISNGSLLLDHVVDLFPDYTNWTDETYVNPQNHFNHSTCQNQINYPSSSVMSDFDFSNFIRSLNNAAFENTKISISKTVLANNYFTTYQVKQIIQEFSFENSKLEFAKAAYSKTIDRNNYYSVSDLFSFNSSILDLNNFIVSR